MFSPVFWKVLQKLKMDNVKGESVDLNELFKAAANSRLTPTAAEFVPRSSNFGGKHFIVIVHE